MKFKFTCFFSIIIQWFITLSSLVLSSFKRKQLTDWIGDAKTLRKLNRTGMQVSSLFEYLWGSDGKRKLFFESHLNNSNTDTQSCTRNNKALSCDRALRFNDYRKT